MLINNWAIMTKPNDDIMLPFVTIRGPRNITVKGNYIEFTTN